MRGRPAELIRVGCVGTKNTCAAGMPGESYGGRQRPSAGSARFLCLWSLETPPGECPLRGTGRVGRIWIGKVKPGVYCLRASEFRSANSRKPKTSSLLYLWIRLFATPEATRSKVTTSYGCGKSSAVDAAGVSMCVRAAGGGRATAVMRAVTLHRGKPTAEPKEDTAGRKKARRLTARVRSAVGWD